MKKYWVAALVMMACVAVAQDQPQRPKDQPKQTQEEPQRAKPEGAPKTAKTRALAAGAKVAQKQTPVEQLTIHLNGFHAMRDNPSQQVEASHFCRQVNQDFAQCALFDGEGEDANLTGVEYIISEKLYDELPADEKRYWHPHNYEILAGQLVAPGLPNELEKSLMKDKINSYGKTWHVWMTGVVGHEADPFPIGEPHLAWSFNRDGEADPVLLQNRDKRLDVDTWKKRKERADLAQDAKPQDGVNLLRDAFASGGAPAGVVDKADVKK